MLEDNDIGGPGMAGEYPELKKFFELNTNIQTFSTTFNILRRNFNCFLDSNIKIKLLRVNGDCFLEYGMDPICDLIHKLHDQGFYKRLHVHVSDK